MQIQTLPVSKLYESPTNPRKYFDPVKQAELNASVKERGILQRPLVRHNPCELGEYEVVIGSRRFRAALAASLDEVPVDVREMDDEEAQFAQQVENLNRADLTPLEEADGYRFLMEQHGLTMEQVAARIGRDRGHVYKRLQLCSLGEEGRKALGDGAISAGVALIVARLSDPKAQAKAVEYFASRFDADKEQVTTADASHYVRHTFMLRLKSAPFDVKDAELLPKAGACTTCPMRTGSQPDLFEDLRDDEDLCTDPACHQQKCDAAWAKRKAAAYEHKLTIIEKPAEVKKLFPYGSDYVNSSAGFVKLGDRCSDDPKHRTYKALLGKDAATALARAPNGEVVELLDKSKVKAALKSAGHDFKKEQAEAKKKAAEKPPTDKELAAKAHEKAVDRIVTELVARVEKRGSFGVELLRFMTLQVLLAADWVHARRNLNGGRYAPRKDLEKYVAKLTEAELAGLIFEAAMPEPYAPDDADLLKACKLLGVDAAAITKAVKAEVAASAKPVQAAPEDVPAKKTKPVIKLRRSADVATKEKAAKKKGGKR